MIFSILMSSSVHSNLLVFFEYFQLNFKVFFIYSTLRADDIGGRNQAVLGFIFLRKRVSLDKTLVLEFILGLAVLLTIEPSNKAHVVAKMMCYSDFSFFLFWTKRLIQLSLLALGVQFTVETSIKGHIAVKMRRQPSSQPQSFLRYRIWAFLDPIKPKRANFGLTDHYPEKETNHLLKPKGPIIHFKSQKNCKLKCPRDPQPAHTVNDVLELLSMKKDPFNQIITKWLQKVFLSIYWRNVQV